MCCANKLSFPRSQLPVEVMYEIVDYLHAIDVVMLSRTCFVLHSALEDNVLWRRIFRRMFSGTFSLHEPSAGVFYAAPPISAEEPPLDHITIEQEFLNATGRQDMSAWRRFCVRRILRDDPLALTRPQHLASATKAKSRAAALRASTVRNLMLSLLERIVDVFLGLCCCRCRRNPRN